MRCYTLSLSQGIQRGIPVKTGTAKVYGKTKFNVPGILVGGQGMHEKNYLVQLSAKEYGPNTVPLLSTASLMNPQCSDLVVVRERPKTTEQALILLEEVLQIEGPNHHEGLCDLIENTKGCTIHIDRRRTHQGGCKLISLEPGTTIMCWFRNPTEEKKCLLSWDGKELTLNDF